MATPFSVQPSTPCPLIFRLHWMSLSLFQPFSHALICHVQCIGFWRTAFVGLPSGTLSLHPINAIWYRELLIFQQGTIQQFGTIVLIFLLVVSVIIKLFLLIVCVFILFIIIFAVLLVIICVGVICVVAVFGFIVRIFNLISTRIAMEWIVVNSPFCINRRLLKHGSRKKVIGRI